MIKFGKQLNKIYFSSSTGGQSFLSLSDLNKNALRAEKQYEAFVGQIMQTSMEIKKNLEKKTLQYNFDKMIDLQLGSIQQQGQKTLTFNRQVLAGLLNPELVGKSILSEDAEKRIQYYQQQINGEWNIGIQTDGEGLRFIRDSVINYIQTRDKKYTAESVENICLSEGVLKGMNRMLSYFIKSYKDGVMIPIPKYPFYSAATTLNGGSECHYYLNEGNDWQISYSELQKYYNEYVQMGIKPKIIIVCNPNNPTGSILTKQAIREIIEFSFNNKLIIFADEVYQDNVYTNKKTFQSFKSIRDEMEKPYNETELISFHSSACGFQGEGGLKGGYFQMSGIDPEIIDKMHIIRGQSIGSNTIGQICVDLMCNPPKKDLVKAETFETYEKERQEIYQKQKENCQAITAAMKNMMNVSCNEIQGSIYAFPKVKFSQKAIQLAQQNGQAPDVYYALKLLYETGIAILPGSFFGEIPGHYHFRMSTIIHPKEKLNEFIQRFKAFNEKFHSSN